MITCSHVVFVGVTDLLALIPNETGERLGER